VFKSRPTRRDVLRLMSALVPEWGWFAAPFDDLGSMGCFWAVNSPSRRPGSPSMSLEAAQALAVAIWQRTRTVAPQLHIFVSILADDGGWAVVDGYQGKLSEHTTKPALPSFFRE
jgi:hypothetical protein